MAFRVIEEAELNSISVVALHCWLVHVLYRQYRICYFGAALFAVASILAYVYQLERGVNTALQEPEIPSDFIFDEFGKP